MIIKGKDVIGLKIVTIDTGTVIETVDDIAFNPNTHRVEALLVSSGGLFSKAKAIHMDDVRNIGEDAVIVPEASVIKPINDLDQIVHSIADSNKHLVKTNVLTIDGKELGKVTDIYFDSANGYVEKMEVSQGGLKTIAEGKKSIKPTDIVTIGADATIVSTYTELLLENQGEEGGLKGAFNDAKEKTAEAVAAAKDTAQDVAERAKEVGSDVAATVKEKSEELRDKTAEVSKDASERLKEKADEAKVVIDQKSAEAKVKAEEIKDDVAAKSRELNATLDEKAQDLKEQFDEKSHDARIKTDELVEDAKQKASELNEVAREKADIAKDKADELAKDAKREVERAKDKAEKHARAAGEKTSEVISKTREEKPTRQSKIEIEKTTITRK